MRVRLFKKTKDNQSYFQFIADNDQVVLNSQGYASKDARNNGVRSVVANANDADRYERQSADGKHFFILKAGNNQEVARSVNFEEEASMETAIASCMKEIPEIASSGGGKKAAAAVPAATTSDANPYEGEADGDDNYKPLAFYQERIKGEENGFDTFAAEDGSNFYFTLNRGGNIVLISESYTSQSGRNNGVESVTKNLPIRERYQNKVHPNGKFYFNLLAGNNQEIATSVWFDSAGERDAAINGLLSGFSTGTATGDLAAMEEGYRATVAIDAAPVVATTDAETPKKKRKKRVKREPKQEKVLLKNGSYLFNDVTYQTMQSGNGKYYFSFRNAAGKSILLNANVRGFDTEEDVDAAVQRVMEFGPTEANYQGKTTKNGKFYFYLKDSDDKNIGKSFFFETVDDMQTAIGLLIGRGIVAAPEASVADRDEYLACDRYAGDAGFHRFFNAESEEWYFGFNRAGGKTCLRSEGYTTEAARDNGIASVIKNAPLDTRWKMIEEEGEFFYALRAGNHQEIARSCPYADAASRDAAWAWLTGDESTIGFNSVDRDGIRWSAAMIKKEEEEAERQRKEAEAAAAAKAAEEEAKRKAEEERKRKEAEAAAAAKAAEEEAKRKAEEEAERQRKEAAAAAAAAKAAEEAAKAKRKEDDYLACKEYEAHAGATSAENPAFATFEQDGEFYFAWVEDGKVLMRSEGYTTSKARDNGIASVQKNWEMEERYSIDEKMNYFFVVLKAGNHQEIARSCPFKDRSAAMALFPSEREKARAAKLAAAAKAAEEAAKAKRKDDDYLACKEYEAHVGATSAENPAFATFEQDGEFYFAWVEDGKVLMRSEGYTTSKARDNGMASVQKNWEMEERYSIDEKMNYFFVVLKAGNHQEIARSCPFKERAAAMALFPSEREKARAAKLAAAAPPKPVRKEDDYLACKEYEAHMDDVSEKYPDFITFEHDGEYYFAWIEDKAIVLRSEGYTTAKARNNGIESVMKNREIEERFSVDEKMGYHFLVLKAGNHQEIGRGCPSKDKAALMAWFPSGRAASLAAAAALAAAAIPMVTPEEKEDDYLPCSAYEGKTITDKANNLALFETGGQYYFVIYNKDGSVRLRSEGFETTANRDDEMEAAIKHLGNQEMYTTMEWGKYRLHILKDENGREVGRSCLERIPAAVIPPAEKEDDYLKCEEYEGRNVNDKQNKVTLFKHENGQFYFAVYDNDGKVRIRSEGFRDAKERDVELSGVLKNIDNDEMYEEIRKGKYRIRVLKDKTGREVGRSCLERVKEAAAIIPPVAPVVAAATAAAAVVPPKKVKAVPPPPPPPVATASSGFKWWWLLPLLLIPLLFFLWKGCDGCSSPPPPPINEPAVVPTPEPEVDAAAAAAEAAAAAAAAAEAAAPPPAVCNCGEFSNGLFSNISTSKTKSLTRLGTYPEFGNSHALDAAGFYNKLKNRHANSRTDKRFLDKVFRQMGYANGFSDANADLFSSVTLNPGTVGYMGYGKGHQTTYASLDTKGDDLKAFRIEAANGCTMHFMKTCGNHFFFCPK